MLAPVVTADGFPWTCLNQALAAWGWWGQGEVVVIEPAGSGRGWMPLPLVAPDRGGLEWLRTGRSANKQQLRGCAGGRSPLFLIVVAVLAPPWWWG
jgi:hypothetical protein